MSDALMSMNELAQLLGMPVRKLTGEMTKFETKLRGTRLNEGGVTTTYYDRDEAMAWAELWRKYWAVAQGVQATPHAKAVAPRKPAGGQITPARTPARFRPLSLPPELRTNFERASQVQKPMYTPEGVGNGTERQFGFGRGS